METKVFDGQVVVVTGAGRGIGQACALQLAAAGASVVVNDLQEPSETVQAITDAGGSAIGAVASVADDREAKSIIEAAVDAFGGVDAIVNNAGIFSQRDISDVSPDDFRAVVDVHLIGSFQLARHAWPNLTKSSTPRIVNISSGAGLYGLPRMLAYSAAKAGIVGLTHALALEGAEHGILVNAVSPAARTTKQFVVEDTADEDQYSSNALLAPLGERVGPQYATPIMVYLASPACTVTDRVYAAGGARYARIFTSEGQGWTASGLEVPTPQLIDANFDLIDSTASSTAPTNMPEAMSLFAK